VRLSEGIYSMTEVIATRLSACGRVVGAAEVEQVRELVQLCSGLSRRELALTLCEHWGWVGATGNLQRRACEKLLERLEREGLVKLPAKRETLPRRAQQTALLRVGEEEAVPEQEVAGELRSVGPVHLERIGDKEEKEQWRAYVERYPVSFVR
jgi:hypothetical protein